MKKMKSIVFLGAILLFSGIFQPVKGKNGNVDHSTWDTMLNKYVSNDGVVNYKELKKEEPALNSYIQMLGDNIPQKTWGQDETLAYWINLYNASTVSLILKNYPLKSIRDIGKPWDIVFINAGGKKYSLNDIEHNIIRKQFNEPRIHFALVCAAKSCPPLLNEAYNTERLDDQLQKQGIKFINNNDKNIVGDNEIKISKLFDWYKGDFTKNGSLVDFLNGFSKTKISSNAEINFMDYDWSLNE